MISIVPGQFSHHISPSPDGILITEYGYSYTCVTLILTMTKLHICTLCHVWCTQQSLDYHCAHWDVHSLKSHILMVKIWVIPCQINTKNTWPSRIWMKLGSYIVSVETFTRSQFQHYMLYGFRVRANQKVNFLPNLVYPFGQWMMTNW